LHISPDNKNNQNHIRIYSTATFQDQLKLAGGKSRSHGKTSDQKPPLQKQCRTIFHSKSVTQA